MDDILNIDECLSDSFSLSSDTDIKNIVDQWKRSDFLTEGKDSKIFDTRTFTRPKKRLFSNSDVNNSFISRPGTSVAQADQSMSSINLQIGGLVTSMQRSFLGDVSPPVSVLIESSSIDQMGNSLITSSDFANINEFINGEEDTLSSAQFNQYTLNDAIKDRNFLERLTTYDDSLFTKDADIEKTDVNQLMGNFSGNSTLQNSMSSSGHTAKNDDTFTPEGNVTFSAVGNEGDRTFLHLKNSFEKNSTFELGTVANSTFDANRKKSVPFDNKTEELIDNESMIFNETFGVTDRTFDGSVRNSTVNLSKGGLILDDSPMLSPTTRNFPVLTKTTDVFQSTPSRQLKGKNTMQPAVIMNISPIVAEECNKNNLAGSQGNNHPNESPTEEVLRPSSQSVNHLGILNLRDEERRSLTNFEEFENTLSLLENGRDEKELDDLLNSFGSNHCAMNEKMRQSLDNIKKRHSIINLEKQHQDELRRMDGSLNRSINGDFQNTSDRHRLNDSLNKLMMSSSGSGERLLRRSRLYDDATLNIAPVMNTDATHVIKNTALNETVSNIHRNPQSSTEGHQLNGSGGENHELGVNQTSETYSRNTTHSYPLNETQKTDYASPQVNDVDTDKSNRDRFKTIRIFKRPPENAKMVPELNDNNTNALENIPPERKFETVISNEHFTTKNTNSPKSAGEPIENDGDTTNRRTTGVVALKKSALTRPKYLSGIAKRDPTARSSSQEILSSNNDVQRNPQAKAPALKSPMGIKAKSIHNLAGNSTLSKYSNSHESQRESRSTTRDLNLTRTTTANNGTIILNKTPDERLFKVPASKPAMSQRQPLGLKKLSLVRPSSGYYSMNKRNDSDTESGRFSSNNSLSSGSSRGSLHKQDNNDHDVTLTLNRKKSTNEEMNKNSTILTQNSTKIMNGDVKPSGLRQPSNIRRSGLPRPSGIPKR